MYYLQNYMNMYILKPASHYGKCPKISYTKLFDKMAYANSEDPDQTNPEWAIWSGCILFAIPLNISWNNCE